MGQKHLIGICFSVLILWACTSFFPYKPHVSDSKLIKSFYENRANFEKIVKMANEDSAVKSIYRDLVQLKGYNTWQNDTQEGLSTEPWNEYKNLFNQLGSSSIRRVSKEGDILKFASASIAVSDIDEQESIVISKGYAHSLKEPSPLVDSLDEMGFESRGTFYKKIDEHWYLFHDWGVSKPE
ncbi:MAG: hypothetical protein IPN69_17280 [Acidobacteria bacterium]|nr:hypothetical protein [Acidobacteriota bacterium]